MARAIKKPLELSPEAAAQYLEALRYIKEYSSPYAARQVKSRLDKALALIAKQPGLYRPGAVAGTRECPADKTSYTIIFEERPESIWIHHFWHQRRDDLPS